MYIVHLVDLKFMFLIKTHSQSKCNGLWKINCSFPERHSETLTTQRQAFQSGNVIRSARNPTFCDTLSYLEDGPWRYSFWYLISITGSKEKDTLDVVLRHTLRALLLKSYSVHCRFKTPTNAGWHSTSHVIQDLNLEGADSQENV